MSLKEIIDNMFYIDKFLTIGIILLWIALRFVFPTDPELQSSISASNSRIQDVIQLLFLLVIDNDWSGWLNTLTR